MIPDFDFYQETYRGRKIPQEEFSAWAARAVGVIDRYERIYTVAPAAALLQRYSRGQLYAMAYCSVADVLYFYDKAARAGESQSATVGSVSYSTTRGQIPPSVAVTQAAAQYAAAGRYLDIYRGAY